MLTNPMASHAELAEKAGYTVTRVDSRNALATGSDVQSSNAGDWLDDYGGWFNDTFGSGWSETVGEDYLYPAITSVVSNERLAGATAAELTTATAIGSTVLAVGIVAGGEMVLGVGTIGSTYSLATVGARLRTLTSGASSAAQ